MANVFFTKTQNDDNGQSTRKFDIEDCEEFWAWLYEYLSSLQVREYNSALVDYAEYILSDPQHFPDYEINYNIKGRFSFLGHVLRLVGDTTETRPYSAQL